MKNDPDIEISLPDLTFTAEDLQMLRAMDVTLGGGLSIFVDRLQQHLLSCPEMSTLFPNDSALTRWQQSLDLFFEQLMAGSIDLHALDGQLAASIRDAQAGVIPGWLLDAYSSFLGSVLPWISQACDGRSQAIWSTQQTLIKLAFLDCGFAIQNRSA
jgi:hypothetical protein